MGRRNEHSRDEQREMALAAAERLLLRSGAAALSMRKVADAIGYTVGNLYLLFENQDDLLACVNERTTDEIHAALSAAIAHAREPGQRLRRMALAYIEYAQAHPHRWRLLFELQLPAKMLPRQSSELRIQRMFELVESCLKPLMPQTSAARLRVTAATLWSGVHGVSTLAVTGKLKWSGTTDFRPFCEQLVATFLAGIAVQAKSAGR